MDKEDVREIARKYTEEIRRFVNPVSVILFGSHVSGVPHAESDIDIAVLVRGDVGDWLSVRSKLHGLRWNDCFTDIDPHLLDIDEDPCGFASHVIKTGQVIYPAT